MGKIDVPRLFALWADPTLNRDDIARLLGVGGTALQKASQRYGLPPRNIPQARREARADPTPEEIKQRLAEVWEMRNRGTPIGGVHDASA